MVRVEIWFGGGSHFFWSSSFGASTASAVRIVAVRFFSTPRSADTFGERVWGVTGSRVPCETPWNCPPRLLSAGILFHRGEGGRVMVVMVWYSARDDTSRLSQRECGAVVARRVGGRSGRRARSLGVPVSRGRGGLSRRVRVSSRGVVRGVALSRGAVFCGTCTRTVCAAVRAVFRRATFAARRPTPQWACGG